MLTFRHALIFGATSVIAQHVARQLISQGVYTFTLVGRNALKLEEVQRDLQTRANPGTEFTCAVKTCDLCDPSALQALVSDLDGTHYPDLVLIAQGTSLPPNTVLQNDLPALRDSLTINAISPVLCAEAVMPLLLKQRHGTLAIIGSVAGDRGRGSNYLYGAAKACEAALASGLAHRCHGSGVNVCLIKPGPTRTPLAAHLEGRFPLAEPKDVASTIIKGLRRSKRIIYVPLRWRYIMLIIRLLPDFIFHRTRL